jgi:hypothetical protein
MAPALAFSAADRATIRQFRERLGPGALAALNAGYWPLSVGTGEGYELVLCWDPAMQALRSLKLADDGTLIEEGA